MPARGSPRSATEDLSPDGDQAVEVVHIARQCRHDGDEGHDGLQLATPLGLARSLELAAFVRFRRSA